MLRENWWRLDSPLDMEVGLELVFGGYAGMLESFAVSAIAL